MNSIDRYIPIIYIILIIVIIYQIKGIFKGGIFAKSETDLRISKETINQFSKKIDKKKLSYSLDSYGRIADKLYQSMKGIGTDNVVFMANFKLIKNINDLYQLFESFGLRDDENLIDWINNDINKINIFGLSRNDLNEILNSKKINFKF